jgi:hypothetical protein
MFGSAKGLKVKHFNDVDECIDDEINEWLESNPQATIIDIKFSASGTVDEWCTDVLVIYRT